MMSNKRSILITGGTSGIGRALVQHYFDAGWKVLTCGRSPGRIAALERELPGVGVVPCDLAVAGERRALVEHVRLAVESLDGLINNAGIQHSYPYAEGQTADLELEIAINLAAPVDLAQQLAPLLEKAGSFVANVSSGLAYIPLGRAPLYCATKAALSQYTRSLREQTGSPLFIEVVMPLVETPMSQGRGGGKISAEEAARQTARGIARRRETVWVGQSRLLPFMTRFAPRILRSIINRQTGY